MYRKRLIDLDPKGYRFLAVAELLTAIVGGLGDATINTLLMEQTIPIGVRLATFVAVVTIILVPCMVGVFKCVNAYARRYHQP